MNDVNWALARKRQNLEHRARVMQTIRAFFVARGYLEVETPQRIPCNAPEAHIDPIRSGEWVLHTSPELAMKRLLAAGYANLFQLCKVWREGERGQRHLPEFTMLEWYRSGVDYHALMQECMELFAALCPAGELTWQGTTVDLTPPWPKLTLAEAFACYAPISLEEALATDRFEEILTDAVEPRLGTTKPTFIIEYPQAMAPLARSKPGDPGCAERFELYLCGIELANAFSELTDAQEQRQRLIAEESTRQARGKAPSPLPEPFLAEVGNIPSAAGIALGIDRLVMLLTDARDIAEVVTFTPEEL